MSSSRNKAASLHLNLFWPTLVPVPCQCNGFALIMQGREGKSHAERVRVHVWGKIGSDRCSVHRFAYRFREHGGGTGVWIGTHVDMKVCMPWWTEAELSGPHQSRTEWLERFAALFLWWLPVSYFPSFRPHTFDYPHPFPASSLLYASLSLSLHSKACGARQIWRCQTSIFDKAASVWGQQHHFWHAETARTEAPHQK